MVISSIMRRRSGETSILIVEVPSVGLHTRAILTDGRSNETGTSLLKEVAQGSRNGDCATYREWLGRATPCIHRSGENTMNAAQSQLSLLAALIRSAVLHPAVQVAAALWIVANVAVLLLPGGVLPFDRPALADMPFVQQVALPSLGLIEVFALMAVVYVLTGRRVIPDLAARAPERAQAARETTLLLGYAGLGQLGGWLVGPALGYRPFSFHIAGTVVGCSVPPSVGELWTWAIYNLAVFAVVPYLWFRRRYSATQLGLRSTNRTNDLLVIVVVAVIESLVELGAFPGIFQLSARFGVFMIGTVLPTMVLIYAILVPRYLKLTGSSDTTVILGGVTYAAMHIVEGWSVFTTPRDIALSLIFVVLQYFGPGMMKTV